MGQDKHGIVIICKFSDLSDVHAKSGHSKSLHVPCQNTILVTASQVLNVSPRGAY